MNRNIIYFQDESGRVYKSFVDVSDGKIVRYPEFAFDPTPEGIKTKPGFSGIDPDKAEALLAEQSKELIENYLRAKSQLAEARSELIKEYYGRGEFGMMTPTLIDILFDGGVVK